ncbi:FliM/FliN family flagellar motor C-terminal domain-containing protein [Litoreibacter sp.]|nr:FliM/FliN family flagellar motor C-terminal domain-containing protein [Litoreibacter sp.]
MPDDGGATPQSDHILESVKVELGVLIGKAHPTMGTLSSLDVDEVLSLDTAIEDPVQLYIGNKLIAEGMLEELSDAPDSGIGVRITRVIQQQKA